MLPGLGLGILFAKFWDVVLFQIICVRMFAREVRTLNLIFVHQVPAEKLTTSYTSTRALSAKTLSGSTRRRRISFGHEV